MELLIAVIVWVGRFQASTRLFVFSATSCIPSSRGVNINSRINGKFSPKFVRYLSVVANRRFYSRYICTQLIESGM